MTADACRGAVAIRFSGLGVRVPSSTIRETLLTAFQATGDREVIAANKAVGAATAELAGANRKVASSIRATTRAESKLNDLHQATGKSADGLAHSTRDAAQTAERMSTILALAGNALRDNAKAQRSLERERRKSIRAQEKQATSLKGLRTRYTELKAQIDLTGQALGAARAALNAVAGKPITLSVDFETGLARIRTLGRATRGELEGGLAAIAKRVPQNLNDITAAAYDAISAQANRSNAEILDLLSNASQVATGAGISLQSAVNGLTGAVNSFGAENLSATRAADILFSTMRVGKTTVEELVAAQGKSLSSASAVGAAYEEVGAIIATATSRGVATAEAFTRMDAVLTLLTKPTRQQQKAFAEMNAELGENAFKLGVADLQAKGLVAKLLELQKASGGSAEALAKLTGRNKEAFQALTQLLTADGGELLVQNFEAIKNGAGDAARAFGELDATTAGQFARLKSEFEAVLVEVGRSLIPTVQTAIADLRAAIAGDNGKAIGETIKSIGQALVSAARGVTRLVKSLAGAFSDSYLGRQIKARLAAQEYLDVVARIGDEQSRNSTIAKGYASALGGVTSKVTRQANASAILSTAVDQVEGGVARLSTGLGAAAQFLTRAAGGSDALKRQLAAASPAAYGLATAIDVVSNSMVEYVSVSDLFAQATAGIDAAIAAAGKVKPKAPRLPKLPAIEVPQLNFELLAQNAQNAFGDIGRAAIAPFVEGAKERYTQGIADFGSFIANGFTSVVTAGIESLADEGLVQALAESEAAIASTQANIDSLTNGIRQGLSAALVDAIVFGASFSQVINQLANSVARQALIQVPLELGYALADQAKFLSTGLPNFQAAAAAHVAAAKTFALIGGGALIAAAVTGGVGGASSGGGVGAGGDRGFDRARLGPSQTNNSTSTNTTVIINQYGPNLATRRDQERQVTGMLNSNSVRRGSAAVRRSR